MTPEEEKMGWEIVKALAFNEGLFVLSIIIFLYLQSKGLI